MTRGEIRRLVLGLIAVNVAAVAVGCSGPAETSTRSETPEQQAARVFALAEELESQGQTKKAYAAYHLLIKKFPTSPEAARANAHIKKVQAAAGRKRKPVVKKG
jgi:Flp pilus assembly protein TadD